MYKLFIVIGEKTVLDSIAELFPWKQVGFEVTGKYSEASKALPVLKEHPADVLLSDTRMPEMSGFEMVRQVRTFSEMRVVMIGSNTGYSVLREALQLRISDFLLKPLNYNDVLQCFENIRHELDGQLVFREPETGSYYKRIVGKVDDYLRVNYQHATLNKAADLVGISTGYLSRIYKEHKGMRFAEMLTRVRMEKAGQLLLDPGYRNYEIAGMVGYTNPNNFTRAFKAFYRMTPKEYRTGTCKNRNESDNQEVLSGAPEK